MSNLTSFQKLEELRRPHSQYTSEDGVMLKNSILKAALRLHPDLLKLIIRNKKLKSYFFTEVEELHIFNKVQYQRFVMNKCFLPDSYTSFKNKIGLATWHIMPYSNFLNLSSLPCSKSPLFIHFLCRKKLVLKIQT